MSKPGVATPPGPTGLNTYFVFELVDVDQGDDPMFRSLEDLQAYALDRYDGLQACWRSPCQARRTTPTTPVQWIPLESRRLEPP